MGNSKCTAGHFVILGHFWSDRNIQRLNMQLHGRALLPIHLLASNPEYLDEGRCHHPRRYGGNMGHVGERGIDVSSLRSWLRVELRGPANAWGSGNYIGATGAVSVVSTNAAAFYVTGVKLEIGSVATPFNRQSLAKSMADCQRYYQVRNTHIVGGAAVNAVSINWNYTFPVIMRATPTINFFMAGGSGYASPGAVNINVDGFSGQATGTAAAYGANTSYLASAEL